MLVVARKGKLLVLLYLWDQKFLVKHCVPCLSHRGATAIAVSIFFIQRKQISGDGDGRRLWLHRRLQRLLRTCWSRCQRRTGGPDCRGLVRLSSIERFAAYAPNRASRPKTCNGNLFRAQKGRDLGGDSNPEASLWLGWPLTHYHCAFFSLVTATTANCQLSTICCKLQCELSNGKGGDSPGLHARLRICLQLKFVPGSMPRAQSHNHGLVSFVKLGCRSGSGDPKTTVLHTSRKPRCLTCWATHSATTGTQLWCSRRECGNR